MKTKHLIIGVSIAVLVVGLSLLAKGQIPSPTDLPRRTLTVNSVGEVVVSYGFTNRASLAEDPVPLLGEPPRALIVRSDGEVLAQIALTNRASVSIPTGKFQVIEGARSCTYRSEGLLTLEIGSARGHSFQVVAQEIELLW